MEKLFSGITSSFSGIAVAFGLAGGVVLKLLGGYDKLLHLLVVLVVVDYATGILKGIANKSLSSEVGFRGLIKKILIFSLVAVSVSLQYVVGNIVPLREVVIVFYVANEGLSILENVGEFLPLPPKLKEVLMQLRSTEQSPARQGDKQQNKPHILGDAKQNNTKKDSDEYDNN